MFVFETNKKCQSVVPDLNVINCVESYPRPFSSPLFSSLHSGDGVSLRPEGACGHDVHRHSAGLLSGCSLCSHPQVSRPHTWVEAKHGLDSCIRFL